AVAHAPRIFVQQVSCNDLEIIVGRMGEGAAAVAIAERPGSRNIGAQLIVNLDVAAGVDGDAGLVQAEVVGIGTAADGEQQMRSYDAARHAAACEVSDTAGSLPGDAEAPGREPPVRPLRAPYSRPP